MNAYRDRSHDRYLSERVLTATPIELIQLLLDRCVGEIEIARRCLDDHDRAGALPHLRRSQDIVTELRAALDLSQGPLAISLDALYDYSFSSLIEGQLTGAPEHLAGPVQVLSQVRDGWRAAFPAGSPPGVVAAATASIT